MKKLGARSPEIKKNFHMGALKTTTMTERMYSFRTNPGEIFPEAFRDLVVFCHLRWDFVFQRPQHLLTRCAKQRRVFYVEEPIFSSNGPKLESIEKQKNIFVVTPQIPHDLNEEEIRITLKKLLDEYIFSESIKDYVLWYYTPMALPFSRHLFRTARGAVYDCMDELSMFKNAPKSLLELEAELFSKVNVSFTGGHALYEHKMRNHSNIFPFPSSIDVSHFNQARSAITDPDDQKSIKGKKVGFFGVVDERMDLELLNAVATKRPEVQFIILGPVVKICSSTLPNLPNIHYLGSKSYTELPKYIASWDVAMMPFARNDSTKFISPTKTPEFLAGGKPVVSTSIKDVVRPYEKEKLVKIADTADGFVKAIDELLAMDTKTRKEWLQKVDKFLSTRSWDKTWQEMLTLVTGSLFSAISVQNQRTESQQIRIGT